MVDSTVAARINGFLRGYGKRYQLIEWLPTFKLSQASERVLLAAVNA